VQVLMRADGAHKFIEDLMWKTQMEERKKGIGGISRGCFTSYMLVWDLGDFTTYEIVVFAWRYFADDVLGYFLGDAWMIVVG
jgi:hypothetical protein